MEGLLVHEVAFGMFAREPALNDLDVDFVPGAAQQRVMQQCRDIRAEANTRRKYRERRHCWGIESMNEARSASDSRCS